MSKYQPLWEHIGRSEKEALTLTFAEIGGILGFELDHSFLNHKKELIEYGYMVKKISIKNETVIFERISPEG